MFLWGRKGKNHPKASQRPKKQKVWKGVCRGVARKIARQRKSKFKTGLTQRYGAENPRNPINGKREAVSVHRRGEKKIQWGGGGGRKIEIDRNERAGGKQETSPY